MHSGWNYMQPFNETRTSVQDLYNSEITQSHLARKWGTCCLEKQLCIINSDSGKGEVDNAYSDWGCPVIFAGSIQHKKPWLKIWVSGICFISYSKAKHFAKKEIRGRVFLSEYQARMRMFANVMWINKRCSHKPSFWCLQSTLTCGEKGQGHYLFCYASF